MDTISAVYSMQIGNAIWMVISVQKGQALGIKEDLAMYLEQYGDARVISVTERGPAYQQIKIQGIGQSFR